MASDSEFVSRKLNDLRVVDLKAELEKRGLDKTGVKIVLLERLQQALQKEGHDPEEYHFEVNETTPSKKPNKRTNRTRSSGNCATVNAGLDKFCDAEAIAEFRLGAESVLRWIDEQSWAPFEAAQVTRNDKAEQPLRDSLREKLTRDDESETHSNVDESHHDLTLDDDEKMESDEEGAGGGHMDEKILDTTDGGEDAIDLSIEEEEKLLTEEDDVAVEDKAGAVNSSAGAIEPAEKRSEVVAEVAIAAKSTTDTGAANKEAAPPPSSADDNDVIEIASPTPDLLSANSSKGDDNVALIVGVEDEEEEAHNGLDTDAASPGASHSTRLSRDADGSINGEATATTTDSFIAGKNGSRDSAAAAVENVSASKSSDGGVDKSKASPDKESSGVGKAEKSSEEEKASGGTGGKPKSPNTATVKDGKPIDKVTRPVVSGGSKNLWVTGLSSSTRATDLKTLFSKHGKVVGAKIVSNARSSTSRCYGFVTMATADEASKCIQHLHRTELHGRLISVEKAKTEPLGPSRPGRVDAAKPVAVAKKTPEKRDSTIKEGETPTDDKTEKAGENIDKAKDNSVSSAAKADGAKAEGGEGAADDSKGKDEKRETHRKSSPHSERSSGAPRERTTYERAHDRYVRGRRPFINRGGYPRRGFAPGMVPRSGGSGPLSFHHIREERERQREREEEREMREMDRRRRIDMSRQREVERKQLEEALRLERERERLRIEREKLERERAEVLRLEREKQRMERERIEREREELRRRASRIEDSRRPVKRSFDSIRDGRDQYEARKKPAPIVTTTRRIETFEHKSSERYGGGSDPVRRSDAVVRRDSSVHSRGGANDDIRGSRDHQERGRLDVGGRGGGGSSYQSRGNDATPMGRTGLLVSKDEWKGGPRGGHHHAGSGMSRGDRYDSKSISTGDGYGHDGRSNSSRYVERNDSWGQGGSSGGGGGMTQSDHRGGGSKVFSSGGGIQSRDTWGGGGERKVESQSWGRSDGSQGNRWGGGGGAGGGHSRGGGSDIPTMINQAPMFESSSISVIGMGSGGGSNYNSERFDAYKSINSVRRF